MLILEKLHFYFRWIVWKSNLCIQLTKVFLFLDSSFINIFLNIVEHNSIGLERWREKLKLTHFKIYWVIILDS